jgi:hypothetical protein
MQVLVYASALAVAGLLSGYLLGFLSVSSKRVQASARNLGPSAGPGRRSPATKEVVKAALADLNNPQALGRSPLCSLSGLASDPMEAAGLRALLVDVVVEIAACRQARDAESGRLLLDYYVKRVGSHEVVMERLYLSRPTFYRRLNRGLILVAERLAQLGANTDFETALRLPLRSAVADPVPEIAVRQRSESRGWPGNLRPRIPRRMPGRAQGVWS